MRWLGALVVVVVLAGCANPGSTTTESSSTTQAPSTTDTPTSTPTTGKRCDEGVRPNDYYVLIDYQAFPVVYPDNGEKVPAKIAVKHRNWDAVASVRWTFVDWTGRLVNQSTEDRFEGTMDRVGTYFLRLEGFDCNGNLVGIHGRAYGVNQFVVKLGRCDPVATNLTQSCPELQFEINPGHALISVDAPVFLGGTPNMAWWWPHRLSLYDAEGRLVNSTTTAAYVTLDRVGDFAYGTWTARWVPDVAVAAEIEWGAGAHNYPDTVPWPKFPDGWQHDGGSWPQRPSKLG